MIRLLIDMNITSYNNSAIYLTSSMICDECIYYPDCFKQDYENGKPCASLKSRLYLW